MFDQLARLDSQSSAASQKSKGGGGGKPKPPPPEPEFAISAFYVVGDSLVDAGNALALAEFYGDLTFSELPEGAPTADKGYYDGRFTNGFTFADLIANKLVGSPTEPVFPYGYDEPYTGLDIPIAPWASDPTGISLNFAYGGGQIVRGSEVTSDLDEQTDALKDAVDKDFDPDAYVVVTIGGNDVRALVPEDGTPASLAAAFDQLDDVAEELFEELEQLVDEGARNIVLTGIPDVGLVARYDANGNGVIDQVPIAGETVSEAERVLAATEYSAYLDGLIRSDVVPALEALGINIVYVPLADVEDAGGNVVEPGALDLVLPTIAELNGITLEQLTDNWLDYQHLVLFDGLHPTAQVHALVGSYIYAEITGTPWIETMPLKGAEIHFAQAGTISVAGEADAITVQLTKGVTYTIEVLGMSSLGADGSLGDPALTISDFRNKPVTDFTIDSGNDSGLGFDASFTFTTSRSGEYTITITGEGVVTGDYLLQVGVADMTSLAMAASSSSLSTSIQNEMRFASASQRQTDLSVAIAVAGFLTMPGLAAAANRYAGDEDAAGDFAELSLAVAPAPAAATAVESQDVSQDALLVDSDANDEAELRDSRSSSGNDELGVEPSSPDSAASSLQPNMVVADEVGAEVSQMIEMIAVDDAAVMQALLMAQADGERAENSEEHEAVVEEALNELSDAGDVDAIIDAVASGEVAVEGGGAAELAAKLAEFVDTGTWLPLHHAAQPLAVEADLAAVSA